MWDFFRRKTPKSVPLETQLATLASCGISLVPGITIDALTMSFDRDNFEADPYRLALTVMGTEAETEAQAGPGGYPSDNIWHFDTECIEDHGDYARIASRLRALAQGDLPLQQIEDHVDVEAGEAWLAFQLGGQSHRWEAKVEDDWVDTNVLSRFAGLLVKQGRSRRFTYIDLGGGQDCLIGCSTPDQRSALRERTGLKVEWLD